MRFYSSDYGNYRTRKFSNIYPDYTEFDKDVAFFNANGLNPQLKNISTYRTIYMLLASRYKNSSIAYSDETQFKLELFSKIFQFAPNWERELELQKTLRELSEIDLTIGGKAIYNHSYNPSTAPSTQATEELETVNEQNVTKYTKSKLDAYGNLVALLEKDVTEDFIRRFKYLFIKIVAPQRPLWYDYDKTND